MSTECPAIDLDLYLRRIGYRDSPQPNLETLKHLHVAHATHIPFENIDVLRNEPIRLDLESLQEKLVRKRRGGYCFEQNALFAAVLEQIGFRLTRLQARVLMGVTQTRPRTHMAIEVHVGGESWLADVGYGGWGLLEPIPLVEGESRQFTWDYRLRDAGPDWVLSALQIGQWQDLYAFLRAPNLPVDYEPANYFIWQHPDSIFRKLLLIQRPTPEVRYILRNRELVTIDAQGATTSALATDAALLEALAQHFSLEIEPGAWLRFDAEQAP